MHLVPALSADLGHTPIQKVSAWVPHVFIETLEYIVLFRHPAVLKLYMNIHNSITASPLLVAGAISCYGMECQPGFYGSSGKLVKLFSRGFLCLWNLTQIDPVFLSLSVLFSWLRSSWYCILSSVWKAWQKRFLELQELLVHLRPFALAAFLGLSQVPRVRSTWALEYSGCNFMIFNNIL
jgi:hypothetical protein